MSITNPLIKKFYASDKWITFRMVIISERAKRDGGPTCEHCHKRVAHSRELTVHHKIELTPDNVGDAMVSLNPDNVLVVHHDCHNLIHSRFGYSPGRGVYIVYGPPLSGKTTFVKNNKGRNDLVVDIDKLFEAVTLLPAHDKPDIMLTNVRALHNLLLDHIKVRYGKWHSAWIVGGFADKYKREKLVSDLGAELIFMDVAKEECIARLDADDSRRYYKEEYIDYINKWWERYSE